MNQNEKIMKDKEVKRKVENTTFFSDYAYASDKIVKLLIEFEKENRTDSIWSATDEQIERLRELCIELESESKSVLGKLPREFLDKYFLRFSRKEYIVIFDLIKKYTVENGTDSYLAFNEEQMEELKDVIKQFVTQNVFEYLQKQSSKVDVGENIEELVKQRNKIVAEIDNIMKKIDDERKKTNDLLAYLQVRLNELKDFAEHNNFQAVADYQSAQILALRTENQRLLQLIDANKKEELYSNHWYSRIKGVK